MRHSCAEPLRAAPLSMQKLGYKPIKCIVLMQPRCLAAIDRYAFWYSNSGRGPDLIARRFLRGPPERQPPARLLRRATCTEAHSGKPLMGFFARLGGTGLTLVE